MAAYSSSKVSLREDPNGWMRVKKLPDVLKIVLLGDSGVGKTSLGYQFAEGTSLKKPQLTVGFDYWRKDVLIEDTPVKLEIWDTAGTEEYRKSMIPQYYRNVDGVLMVFDLTNEKSFQNLEHWMQELKRYRGMENLAIVLVGNKKDKVEEVKITEAMISRFIMNYHIVDYFETSSQKEEYYEKTRNAFMAIGNKMFELRMDMTVSLAQSVITLADEWVMVSAPNLPRRRSIKSCCKL